ncbi:MAG: hypothetical protein K0Q47_1831, partial [Sedimentibacter sp.]|nr:hypothetical protein [Sedimentibacter sp.]
MVQNKFNYTIGIISQIIGNNVICDIILLWRYYEGWNSKG